MAQPVLPHHGARFQIERITAAENSAQYRVQIFVEDGCYESEATVSIESPGIVWEACVREDQPEQPMAPWMQKHAESLMRTFRQGATRKGVWGRRIRRWRDAPSKPS